ncbi:MAG: sigma-70 family RNA polymerase sigma factor [bacterium]|nr:sigma-70 family RNA polymerase sigma factor [bacterium]
MTAMRDGSSNAHGGASAATRLTRLFARFSRTAIPAVLDEVYRLTATPLERVAWRITDDHVAAQDAVQDVFLDLMRHPGRFDPSRAAWPFLIAMTINKARMIRRRSRHLHTRDPIDHELLADDGAEQLERASWLWHQVASLPREQRLIVAMRYREGRSDREVAAELELPVSTVKSRLRSARAALRPKLGGCPSTR